ncbi:hypothetical protein CspHIS471_0401110 [Cutaneotrichosporon sp. HIS471]|nr:hypothetical protein CspHIS471_0401110 [Cutaneotrichosporon sp. HIS471]
MSASRLQRRACAPEPRGRGRSAVPKRTNSSIAFSCTSLDTALHACGSLSITPSSPSSSSSSPSPPTSPEEEPDALDLPPDAPTDGDQPVTESTASVITRDHTTPYPIYPTHKQKDPRLARVAEPSACTPRPRPQQRRSTLGRSPLSTTTTLPADVLP